MFTHRLRILNVKGTTHFKMKRFIGNFQTNLQIFTKYFKLNNDKAHFYILENNLNQTEPERLMKVINYCETIGFGKDDLLENPILLRMHPCTLDQYYTAMNEGGFRTIRAPTLSKFRTLYRRKISVLKQANLIAPETNVAESFIKYLTPCPKNFNIETYDKLDSWSDVHHKVLTKYLMWRLETTDEAIARLIKTHFQISRKSFSYLCENITVAEELGFSNEKILKYGYILHAYPKNVKEILETYPVVAGTCMRKGMRMYPKLVTTPPSNIKKILKILQEHHISDEAISKRLNVLHLSPETVELRLNELERVADLNVLRHNPNILKLVVHHNRAKSRLAFLKELDLKCLSVTLLGSDNLKFDHHIREGRDANTATDIQSFMKGIFKKHFAEAETTLRKHPYFLQVPLRVMEDTYYYLQEEKFTNSSISQVISILLYPKEKIQSTFKQVHEFQVRTGRPLNQIKRLNLVLYFIEKEHHFTGDGIWLKTEPDEESIQNTG